MSCVSLNLVNRVVFPGEIHRLFGEELLHHLKGFLKTTNAGARAGKRKTQLLKLSWSDSCSQAQFKATLGEQIKRGSFSGEEHGMAILITNYITANAQRCGYFGSNS